VDAIVPRKDPRQETRVLDRVQAALVEVRPVFVK
jgi:hypothetical protein